MRIISYNIHKGLSFFRTKTLKSIKQSLKGLDLDFVFLQECQGYSDSQKRDQYEELADEIWDHYSYGKNAIFDETHHGNAILSRYPIVEFSNFDLTLNSYEKRGLLQAKIEIPNKGSIQLLNTHLNLRERDRLKQTEMIIQKTEKNSGATILAGDFNDWTLKVHQKFSNTNHWKEVGQEFYGKPLKTFPWFYPKLPLDRIYYSKNLNLVTGKVIDTPEIRKLSDHLPIFAEFKLID